MSKRVLVVEDEADPARYLTVVLSDGGYETASADTCEKAWQDILQHPPDLICLDLMMPGHSGLTLYRRLKGDSRFESIPVLVITGAYDAEDFRLSDLIPEESLPEPVAFVEKPIVVASFLKTVRDIVGE